MAGRREEDARLEARSAERRCMPMRHAPLKPYASTIDELKRVTLSWAQMDIGTKSPGETA